MFRDEWKNICCDALKSSERCCIFCKCVSGSDFCSAKSRARILQTNPSLERARIYKLGSRRLGKARILPFATPLYPGEGGGAYNRVYVFVSR